MMKKLMAALTSIAMVVALAFTTVSAATVTVDSSLTGHTFKAYQVLSGTESTTDNQLTNVAWGTGINSEAFLRALKADATVGSLFTSVTTAEQFADAMAEANQTQAEKVAKIAYANKTTTSTAITAGTSTLDSGYYLIVDESTLTGDNVYNAALLQVTNTINISKKTDKPSVEKKVLENTKYNEDGGYGQSYNDVADYNMGDAVPFKLIGTVPDMSKFDTYQYMFIDELSAGLTLNQNSIKVYVSDDRAGTAKTDITSSFTVNVTGQKFTVATNDLKAISGVTQGKYILVEYTATLNQNAVVGLPGNPNTVKLQYSNKPDQSGSGTNTEGGTDNHPHGETPEDKVIVFTYELDVTKQDVADQSKLAGAKFVVMNAAGQYATLDADMKVTGWVAEEAQATVITTGADGLIKVIGLDDGTYVLKETKAPEGYNLPQGDAAITEFTVSAKTANGQTWTSGVATDALLVKADGEQYTVTPEGGLATGTITNKKGSTLPETGGMGTYVIYGAGALLMAAGAAYFVNKKKA